MPIKFPIKRRKARPISVLQKRFDTVYTLESRSFGWFDPTAIWQSASDDLNSAKTIGSVKLSVSRCTSFSGASIGDRRKTDGIGN